MIWESECANWAGAGAAATEQAEPVYQQAPELSPEQLRLISAHFDKVHLCLAQSLCYWKATLLSYHTDYLVGGEPLALIHRMTMAHGRE